MAFRLRNKNIPSAFKQTNQEVTLNADGSGTVDLDKIKWNYEGGNENTAKTRWGYKPVKNKMSDAEWNALSQDERDRLNNAYKVVQNRDMWDSTTHWSSEFDDIYKDHKGMLPFLLTKVRKKYRDTVLDKSRDEVFPCTGDDCGDRTGMTMSQAQEWFTKAFQDSESSDEFIEWSQANASYILEKGGGKKAYNKRSSVSGNWKSK